jgi:hypothetical protein
MPSGGSAILRGDRAEISDAIIFDSSEDSEAAIVDVALTESPSFGGECQLVRVCVSDIARLQSGRSARSNSEILR